MSMDKNVKDLRITYVYEKIPHEIYQDLFYSLPTRLHGMIKKRKSKINNPFYSINASTINLCLGYLHGPGLESI